MGERIQQVAIVGAGAMGAMYAAHFAQTGFDVALVARGERADRLRAGLTVNGTPLVAEVIDVDLGAPHEPADLIIFAVKDRHLPQAIDEAAALVGPETIMVSVINGLDSEEQIAARFGPERVLLCVALGMDAERDGHEVRFRQPGRLVFGEASNTEPPSPIVVRVQEALDRAGLEWQTPPDMRHQLWWKFMVNTGINQASAVLRAGYGAFQPEGDARELMMALINEVLAIANAEGVPLGATDVAAWHRVLDTMPPQGWTSMRQDVAAGRETEVESFAGRIVALGKKHQIATPYNQVMLWILRSNDSNNG